MTRIMYQCEPCKKKGISKYCRDIGDMKMHMIIHLQKLVETCGSYIVDTKNEVVYELSTGNWLLKIFLISYF